MITTWHCSRPYVLRGPAEGRGGGGGLLGGYGGGWDLLGDAVGEGACLGGAAVVWRHLPLRDSDS